jgi:hypothetical protein
MSYRIAGIDVHKKMLAVMVSDVEVDGEYQFERVRYSSSPEHLRLLAEWLITQQVKEVVMESTAQYWKPVWEALERYWKPICIPCAAGIPTTSYLSNVARIVGMDGLGVGS